jgi:hypothetical protein
VVQSASLVGVGGNSDPSHAPAGATGLSEGGGDLPAPGSVVKILDFGLAPLHDGGALFPAEPAQVHKDIADLGRAFADLLFGQKAAQSGRDIPAPVRDILRKMLAEAPDEAFASAGAVVEALANLNRPSAEPAVQQPVAPEPPREPELAHDSAPAAPMAFPLTDVPAEPKIELPPAGTILPMASPPAAEAPHFQTTPSPATGLLPPEHVQPWQAQPYPGAVAEAPPDEAAPLPLPRKSKYGPRFWLGCGFGLLMWIFAGILLVIFIMNVGKPTYTGRQRPGPTNLKAPPVQPKPKAPGQSKAESGAGTRNQVSGVRSQESGKRPSRFVC